MSKYIAILFAEDGAWVSDYEGNTLQEVWNNVEDGGSRWIFYQYGVAIIKNQGNGSVFSHQKIISFPNFEFLQGLTIKQASKFIKDGIKKRRR